MENLDGIASLIRPKMTRYIPHRPTVKQAAFMMLPHREALFGGQAGGGKSDCLLMCALQHVDVPGYAALLLRRTLTDLKLPQAILNRLLSWLQPWIARKEVSYRPGDNHTFFFKNWDRQGNRLPDATITCGYIGESNAYTRYQGIELQFVGVDEVCQHNEGDYTYLFSRLRKCHCPVHQKNVDHDCELCRQMENLPLRVRSTANPGGIGHRWVMKRFNLQPHISLEVAKDTGEKVKYIGKDSKRPFLPSSRYDNPYLNIAEYEKSLEELTDEHKAQLMDGDWGFTSNTKFRQKWKRYYSIQGQLLYLGPNFTGELLDLRRDVREVFQTVDPASSATQGPGDEFTNPRKGPSWTVISTWLLTNNGRLLWLDMQRFREEIPEVVEIMKQTYDTWKPSAVVIESNGIGRGVVQYAERMGMKIIPVKAERDKVHNATNAILQMSKGRIFLPWGDYEWKEAMDEEVFRWQGLPNETDDIVDTLSNAVNHVNWSDFDTVVDGWDGEGRMAEIIETSDPSSLPFVIDPVY